MESETFLFLICFSSLGHRMKTESLVFEQITLQVFQACRKNAVTDLKASEHERNTQKGINSGNVAIKVRKQSACYVGIYSNI